MLQVLGAKDELELMEADMNGDSADVDEDTHVEEGAMFRFNFHLLLSDLQYI